MTAEGVVEQDGLRLAYRRWGDPAAPAVLLIPGLGSSVTAFPPSWIAGLTAGGVQVVAMDNRDSGASTVLDHLPAALRAPAYSLADMAGDAAAVVAALGCVPAHVVGVSMGGMIAQWLAHLRPDLVAALALVMTTPGDPDLPPAEPAATAALKRVSAAADPAERRRAEIAMKQLLAGSRYPRAEAEVAAALDAAAARGVHPGGVVRQYAAILADHARPGIVGTIGAPALILHGTADPLVPAEAARRLAARIAGSRLMLIEGMGHSLPEALAGEIVAALLSLFRDAGRRAAHR